MIVSVVLAGLLSLVLLLVGFVLSVSFNISREKSSPFECGFDPLGSSRVPFSLRFFLLAVIFVVFDVEIILLFPVILVIGSSVVWFSSYFVLVMFLLLLLVGVVHEWREGSLEWGI